MEFFMIDHSIEAKAIQSLKELTKLAAQDGLTYSAITNELPEGIHWEANALKQFVNRESISRKNSKILALAKIVLYYYQSKYDKFSGNKYITDLIKDVEENLLGQAGTDIQTGLVKQYLKLKNGASSLEFPNDYYLIRNGIKNDKQIIIYIQIITIRNNYSFIMKISGKNNLQRVVIGDVLHTVFNTYFSGLSFNVKGGVSLSDFLELDFSNIVNKTNYLLDNPIGMELISFPNTSFINTAFPVCFLGIDGDGKPISGRGLLINGNVKGDFGLFPERIGPSSEQHSALDKKAEEFSLKTVPLSNEFEIDCKDIRTLP